MRKQVIRSYYLFPTTFYINFIVYMGDACECRSIYIYVELSISM